MVSSAFAEQAFDAVIDFSEYPFPGGGTALIQNDDTDQTLRYNLFDDASGAKLSAAPDPITAGSALTYTVSQTDVDAGQVVNMATADATEASQEQITVTTLIAQEQPPGPAAATHPVPANTRWMLALLALLIACAGYPGFRGARAGSRAPSHGRKK